MLFFPESIAVRRSRTAEPDRRASGGPRRARSRIVPAWVFAGLGLLPAALAGAVPADLVTALKAFRTDSPKGWSFTQTTAGAGESQVERFDAARPEFEHWTLLRQNGRAPTADELADYREKQSRRSRGGSAPLLTDRLDLATAQVVAESGDTTTYRCRLQPGERGDTTAEFLVAKLTVHRPTHTIEQFELAATGPFSPTFGVRIGEMKTTMTYSLPTPARPSLLQNVVTRVRGRAFLFKSLDADLVATFSDYEKAHR